jgi:hypothetical protein
LLENEPLRGAQNTAVFRNAHRRETSATDATKHRTSRPRATSTENSTDSCTSHCPDESVTPGRIRMTIPRPLLLQPPKLRFGCSSWRDDIPVGDTHSVGNVPIRTLSKTTAASQKERQGDNPTYQFRFHDEPPWLMRRWQNCQIPFPDILGGVRNPETIRDSSLHPEPPVVKDLIPILKIHYIPYLLICQAYKKKNSLLQPFFFFSSSFFLPKF